jgi:hypothetical protein
MTDTVISSELLRVQFGKETTAGTAVAATKAFRSLSGTFKPDQKSKSYTSQGLRPTTAVIPSSRANTEGSFKGPLDVNELPYILNACLKRVTPTQIDTSGCYTWVWNPSYNTKETIDTFTFEWGDAAASGLGRRAPFGAFTGFSIKGDKDGSEVDAKVLAAQQQEAFTMTAAGSITAIAQQIVPPSSWALYTAATAADLDSATALGLSYNWEVNTDGWWQSNFPIGTTAYQLLPGKFKGTAKLTVMSDATSNALIALFKAGTLTFLRFESIGGQIGVDSGSAPIYETVTIDLPVYVTKAPDPKELEGGWVDEFEFDISYDSVSASFFKVTAINKIASV